MRSQALLKRSRLLLRASAAHSFLPRSGTGRPGRLVSHVPAYLRTPQRWSSSVSPDASSGADSAPSPPEGSPVPPPEVEEPEKPRTRRSRPSTPVKTSESEDIELPPGLDILWSPVTENTASEGADVSSSDAIPPPGVFEDVLSNLHITLHPLIQHRSVYSSGGEPTLALYCPIEGGEYVIDATVKELARRVGGEVVVLDAVQLAAGQWGHFGEGKLTVQSANSLKLPRNPLHFPAATSEPVSSRVMPSEPDDPESSMSMPTPFMPTQISLAVFPMPGSAGRSLSKRSQSQSSPLVSPPSSSRIKPFFDALVNTPSKDTSPSSIRRPRLIYIRDFPTLAPSSAAWYPALLSAVQQRRRGPIQRPSSAVLSPTTIIFGMTPSLLPSPSNPLTDPRRGEDTITSLSIYEEDEASEASRERRLRHRLRQWERRDSSLFDCLPSLADDSDHKAEVIFLGSPFGQNANDPQSSAPSQRGAGMSETEEFFRTSVVVPIVRSPTSERAQRMKRRREINELTMRMAIGRIGGFLEPGNPVIPQRSEADTPMEKEADDKSVDASNLPNAPHRMLEEWGDRIEPWTTVGQIADHATGIAIASTPDEGLQFPIRTQVSWTAVYRAWAAYNSAEQFRKAWIRGVNQNASKTAQPEVEEEELEEEAQEDEVVARVKAEKLDPHESRLLHTIVRSASMPTSFSQVHLPDRTIDAVKTIVSLPLLLPSAFREGILKEHGINGCLLFGPPGTGKTLVVRALAREAGVRMMVISPADVMDMYVGEGEKLVKAVFSLARRLAPCVVFLDEIDALFSARTSGRDTGGTIAHRGVLTEFMQEMDGLRTSQTEAVVVIGATNRPFDLDDAVLRRLPRRLLVDLPGEKERLEILKILLRDEKLSPGVDLSALAKKTESFSGSDLKHLCVAAALDAVKELVKVPWSTIETPASASSPVVPATAESLVTDTNTEASSSEQSAASPQERLENAKDTPRVLKPHNFAKALKEISPSSSEMLGTLVELRKWNQEFGEGNKDRRKKQVWGKGSFGFTDKPSENEQGRIAPPPDTPSAP
ncbi:AAA-domain-containing protein [Fistulina hepatica ATCC 64428]|nr:AAA-domain-containing protein [Fistulina hepatica ATCC 64428]